MIESTITSRVSILKQNKYFLTVSSWLSHGYTCFFRYTWCLGLFGPWPHLAHGCLTVVFPAGILPPTVQHVRLATAQMIKMQKTSKKKSRHEWTIEAHCRFTSYFEQTNQLAENNINPCGTCNSAVW